MKELKGYRSKIDSIDEEILKALNKRTKIVLEIAKIKRGTNATFYSPQREREIIERLTTVNKGPFPSEALKTVYREILSASLALEEPIKVAFLGPLGTFSHLAAQRHFGSFAMFRPCEGLKSVFEDVHKGEANFGVVPIENSTEGVINYTLDLFIDYDLKISDEVLLEIHHNLLSKSGDKSKIKKIYSMEQPYAQCRRWLQTNMPGIPVIGATSTANAAEMASKDDKAAAIASELSAKLYDMRFAEKHIEDNKNNITRFLVIGNDYPRKTGKDKTSIMFSLKDRPGALYDILTPFKKAKMNLTKIESRPSKRKAWEYIFFVDVEGHYDDKKLKNAVENMKKECIFLKILGSYPSGD